MGLNIVQLREMIWRPTGMDTDNDVDLTRTRIDLYLNRSFWEIQDKFPFREKEKTATFYTVAGTRNYDLPYPTEAIQSLAIANLDPVWTGMLDQETAEDYEEEYQEGDPYWGPPTHYVRENCFVRLRPTPDDAYKMVLRRLIVLNDLSATNAPTIPQVWHEIIGYGGLWRAFLDFGDFNRMKETKVLQNSLLNTITPTAATISRRYRSQMVGS